MRKFLFFKDFLSIYQCVFNIFKFSELKFSITATKYTIVTIVESKKLMMVIGAKRYKVKIRNFLLDYLFYRCSNQNLILQIALVLKKVLLIKSHLKIHVQAL